MNKENLRLGWIGLGRMGYPMAERLAKAGYDVNVWNRTRAKAEPLTRKGARIVDTPAELADVDVLFTMVSTGADLEEIYFGDGGVINGRNGPIPRIFVDCSSIGTEKSAEIRARLKDYGSEFLCAPVSGNGKCVKAGKLSQVVSGPEAVYQQMKPYLEAIAANGVAYVGEGELARFCKIAHNVLLGVVTQNLFEIVVLAEKAGISRLAFMEFINNSVMGSIFTRYKTPAIVNLDWTTTFTVALLKKDLDLGLTAGRQLRVPMPVTAATREALQFHEGAALLQEDPKAYLELDFATLLETQAIGSGIRLESENKDVKSGLETLD